MSPPPRPDPTTSLEKRLHLDMLAQPDDFTCGPTCLHAIYRYWGDETPLHKIIEEVPKTPSGGTADVYLAVHALRRSYRATMYTYNVRIFDPTWFGPKRVDLADKLRRQAAVKPELGQLTVAYLEYLQLGGELHFVDLSAQLIRRSLRRGVPILTGLSSTYLYHHVREYGPEDRDDDVRGEPQGHFVVLCGYRTGSHSVMVADPFQKNPMARSRLYKVAVERVIGAIMLGVLTHDANLLLIEPQQRRPRRRRAG
jgi:hypothetical protein